MSWCPDFEFRGTQDYFTNIAPELQCPARYNPADFYMKLTYQAVDAADRKKEAGGGGSGGNDWDTGQLAAEFTKRTGPSITEAVAAHVAARNEGVLKKDKQDTAAFCTAVSMLCIRAGKNVLRDKMLFAARVGQTIGLSLIIMGVYGEVGFTQEDIQSRTGVLFFLSVNQMMLSIMSIVMSFPLERGAGPHTMDYLIYFWP